jgi:hypothetical protein
MANPYNDQRYAMARAMREQKQTQPGFTPLNKTTSATGVAYGRQASNMMSTNFDLKSAIDAIGQGKTSKSPQGGVLGSVLGNSVVQGVLKPLSVLALPGRTVISGLREFGDAVDGNNKTKASFGDFKKQAKDVSFGFGTAFNIDTGSKWLDRAIGFAGDVALDPITYVTFGAGKFAGYAGKLDLAKAVLAHNGDEALAASVARFGRAAIKDQNLLTDLGANNHGLYMLGKRIKVGKLNAASGERMGLRIPGSGAIGAFGDNAMAKMRMMGSETKMGEFVRKWTLPNEHLVARTALLKGATASGKPLSTDTSTALIAYFSATPAMKQFMGTLAQSERQVLAKTLETEAGAGLEGYAKEVYKYLENPELLATATPEIQAAVQKWGPEFFDSYEARVGAAMKEVDPASPGFDGVTNYFPRIQSDAAMAYRANPNSPHAADLNSIYSRDPMAGGKNFKTRTMTKDDIWFGHKLTVDDLKSTDRLNKLANDGGFIGDFFETDIRIVAPRYVDEFVKESGILFKHKHLADAGFWERAAAIDMSGEFVDEIMLESIKKSAGSIAGDLNALYKQSSKAYLTFNDALVAHQAKLSGEIKELLGDTGAVGSREILLDTEAALNDILTGGLTISADQLGLAANALDKSKKTLVDLFGYAYTKGGKLVLKDTGREATESTYLLNGILGHLDSIQDDFLDLERQATVLGKDLTGIELKSIADKTDAAHKLALERLKASEENVKIVLEFGNQLESVLEGVISGQTYARDITDILGIIGEKGMLTDTAVSSIVDKTAAGVKNAEKAERVRQTALRNLINKEGGLFQRLTKNTKLNKTSVTKMNDNVFKNNLPKVFTGELSSSEVRSMSIYTLLNDERIYGENVPEFLVAVRDKLLKNLQEADEAEVIAAEIAKDAGGGARKNSGSIWKTQTKPKIAEAKLLRENIDQMDEFVNLMRNTDLLRNLGDTEISWGLFESHARSKPWLSQFIPDNDVAYLNEEAIKDLMGYYDNVSGGKTIDGAAGYAPWSGDKGLDVTPEFKPGEDVVDSMAVRDFSQSTGARPRGSNVITYNDLMGEIDRYSALAKEAFGAEEFFATGAGVGRKTYSAKSLLDVDAKLSAARAKVKQLRAAKASGTESLSAARELDEALNTIKEITSGGSLTRPEWFQSVAHTNEELGRALFDYHIVSDLGKRWNTVSQIFSTFGIAPSERVFTRISKNVSQQFIDIIDSNLTSTRNGVLNLEKFERAVSDIINNPDLSVSAGRVFQDQWDKLSSAERETIQVALGNKSVASGDAYSLRMELKAIKGRARKSGATRAEITKLENDFYKEKVDPWYTQAFPEGRNYKGDKTAALKQLAPVQRKGAKSTYMTPFADEADAAIVKSFFEKHLGASTIKGRSATPVGYVGESGSGAMVKVVGGENTLQTKIKALKESKARYGQMLDEDLDMETFLRDPGAPQTRPSMKVRIMQHTSERWQAATKEAQTEADNFALRTRDAVSAKESATVLQTEADLLSKGKAVPANFLAKVKAVEPKIKAIETADKAVAAAQSKLDDVTAKLAEVQDSITAKQEAWVSSGKKGKRPLTNTESTRIERLTPAVKSAQKQLDTVQKARDKVPALTPNESKFVDLVKAEPTMKAANPITGQAARPGRPAAPYAEQAKKIIDTYNKKANSVMTAKAKGDERLVQVMNDVAAYDLSTFTDGFKTVDGEYAAFDNGTKVVFTPEEAESLYVGGSVRSSVTSENVNDSIREILQEKKLLEQQYKAAGAAFDAVRRRMPSGQRRSGFAMSVSAVDGDIYQQAFVKFNNEIDRINARVAGLNADLVPLEVSKRALDPKVQASALKKMSILVNGSKRAGAVFDEVGVGRWVDNTHPTLVDVARRDGLKEMDELTALGVNARSTPKSVSERLDKGYKVGGRDLEMRRGNLERAFKSTPEYKHLQELAEMENDVVVALHKNTRDSADSMQNYANELAKELEIARGALSGPTNVARLEQEILAEAQAASDSLKALRGAGPVDADGVPLELPTSPAAVDEFGQAVTAQSAPGGTFVEPGTTPNTRLSAAQAVQAENRYNVGFGKIQADDAEEARLLWTEKRVDPATGRKTLPSLRDETMKTVKTALENKRTQRAAVEDIIKAVSGAAEEVRIKIEVTSGGVDQFMQALNDGRQLAASLQQQLDEVNMLVASMPAKDTMDVFKSMSTVKGGRKVTPAQQAAAIESYNKWLKDNKRVFEMLSESPDDPVNKAWAAAAMADSQLIDLELTHAGELLAIAGASAPEWTTRVFEPFSKEWEKAAKEMGLYKDMKRIDKKGFPNLVGDSEALTLLNSVGRLNQLGVVNDLGRFMSGYTQFFKAYATLSPGFHLRNEISNVFSMFAAGADVKNMYDGFKLWRMADTHFSGGGSVDSFIAILPDAQKEIARNSIGVMLGMGGGRTQDALSSFMARGNARINSNAALNYSKKIGGKLEGSAHFMLAYDSFVKGFDPSQSFNRTKRYLFDYSEKSLLDESMQDIVPFWTWMSRNLPLQITNRWANPKPYLMYQRMVSNSQEGEDMSGVPAYMRNAISLGGDKFLNPDLPFSRVNDQIDSLTDPKRLLGYLNPGIRVPLETMFNQDLYTGKPMTDKQEKLSGATLLLAPFLQATGQLSYNQAGDPVAPSKFVRALTQIIPPIGQAQRVGDKGVNSYLGIPVQTVTQKQKDGVAFGKLEQLRKLSEKQRNIQKAE